MNRAITGGVATALVVAALIGTRCFAQPAPATAPTADQLNLTPQQRPQANAAATAYHQAVERARSQFMQRMQDILTPQQYATLESSMAPPATQPAASRSDATRVPVTFSGGRDTDGRDRGRPVNLVAGGLGVPPQVFRDAFTHVHPAGPGEPPQEQQVRANKRALMEALGPYGVTDDDLNRVSNYYRYRRSEGEMWPTAAAVAYATIEDGAVASITVVNGGSGYSSPPEISVPGYANVRAMAKLAFGKDLSRNGAVSAITLDRTGGRP